jgi:hypothetical protein
MLVMESVYLSTQPTVLKMSLGIIPTAVLSNNMWNVLTVTPGGDDAKRVVWGVH